MGNLRKDYVSERFVIVNGHNSKKSKTKNPYKSGNESMTNPSVLSLVQKDGMLQRLQDDENDFVKNWSVRVFPATDPSVSIDADNSYTDHPLYSEPAYGYHYVIAASPDEKTTLSTMLSKSISEPPAVSPTSLLDELSNVTSNISLVSSPT